MLAEKPLMVPLFTLNASLLHRIAITANMDVDICAQWPCHRYYFGYEIFRRVNRLTDSCHILYKRKDKRLSNSLLSSLILTTDAFNTLALEMYGRESYWEKTFFGHTFTMSRESCPEMGDVGSKTLVMTFKSWLQGHEEAQVMLASVLVVIGMWWLVRTLLALVINLICPILVVLLAVICVPQLRTPLLGQNYPLLANLLKNILMKLAENIKT